MSLIQDELSQNTNLADLWWFLRFFSYLNSSTFEFSSG
jgi:hypothetical protein